MTADLPIEAVIETDHATGPVSYTAELIQHRPASTADIEHVAVAPRLEIDQAKQVVEFFEVIRIEISEESRASHRMRGDLEVVDMCVPVAANARARWRGHCAIL